jgi:hypothetical protein
MTDVYAASGTFTDKKSFAKAGGEARAEHSVSRPTDEETRW